ncbi:putative membrane protein, partial [Vibrio parahaemolyticus EKP-028]
TFLWMALTLFLIGRVFGHPSG